MSMENIDFESLVSLLIPIITGIFTVIITVWQTNKKAKLSDRLIQINEDMLELYLRLRLLLSNEEYSCENVKKIYAIIEDPANQKLIYPDIKLVTKKIHTIERDNGKTSKQEAKRQKALQSAYKELQKLIEGTVNYLKGNLGYPDDSLCIYYMRTGGRGLFYFSVVLFGCGAAMITGEYISFYQNYGKSVAGAFFAVLAFLAFIILVINIKRKELSALYPAFWLRKARKDKEKERKRQEMEKRDKTKSNKSERSAK